MSLRFAAVLLATAISSLHAQNWINPTPAELSMTAQPEVPGATAVYLNREEINDDLLHMASSYARIKILTEGGKEQANVEIPYFGGYEGIQVDEVAGRTIQPDGTIVPFTGKPYQKVIEKSQGSKLMETIFTLPSVQVGSIVEYRYKLRYNDNQVRQPTWYVQNDLYTRNAHFLWKPTQRDVISQIDGEAVTSSIAWSNVLPVGMKVVETLTPHYQMELTVHDIPPTPHEEFMPPLDSVSYRVIFYYTSFRSAPEYWKSAGKRWSKAQDKFIGPGSGVREAVQKLASPTDTPEQKLRKIYAAIMEMENTDFTREHSTREEKDAGFRELRNTDDILARKRGSGDQLAELFIAMARAAGMKAYAMSVADRGKRIFLANYFTTSQLDDELAVVNIDGKDLFFDPGSRYCSFGHLAWRHTGAGGIRQADGGTAIVSAPTEAYKSAHVARVANLTMDDDGKVSGKVDLSFTGDPALQWRHQLLRGDETSLNRSLREYAEAMLPGGTEVRVTSIQNLKEYELPLKVSYEIKGGIGSPTGKRLLIPASLFEENTKPIFPQEKRDLPIDMHYATYFQDAVRVNLPASLKIESLPAASASKYQQFAFYELRSEQTPNSYTMRRNLAMGEPLYWPKDYPELRKFYNGLEAADQQSVVLIRTPNAGKPAND